MIRSLLILCLAAVALAAGATPARALTYADWIAGFNLSPADADPLADPDGDGVVNLVEFAFAGHDPTVPGIIVQRVLWGQRVGSALPHLDPSVIEEASSAVAGTLPHVHAGVEWTPRPGIEGIQWLPEYSRPDGNLNKWFNGRNAVVMTDAPGGKKIAWSLSLTPRPLMTRFFWRIRVRLIDPGEEPAP